MFIATSKQQRHRPQRGRMFIATSKQKWEFDSGWSRMNTVLKFFYKHVNPPGLGLNAFSSLFIVFYEHVNPPGSGINAFYRLTLFSINMRTLRVRGFENHIFR
jgi:hypothetical protein